MKRIILVAVFVLLVVGLLFAYSRFDNRGMQKGCNLAMLTMAELDYLMVSNSVMEAKLSTLTSTNGMSTFEKEYFIKKKSYEFWKADVSRRGHKGTIPQFKMP